MSGYTVMPAWRYRIERAVDGFWRAIDDFFRRRWIRHEWAWNPTELAEMHDRILYDELVWRGMKLGHVEAFEEAGPWYPWAGEDRGGAYSSLKAAREWAERRALQMLGLQATSVGGQPAERDATTQQKVRMP